MTSIFLTLQTLLTLAVVTSLHARKKKNESLGDVLDPSNSTTWEGSVKISGQLLRINRNIINSGGFFFRPLIPVTAPLLYSAEEEAAVVVAAEAPETGGTSSLLASREFILPVS